MRGKSAGELFRSSRPKLLKSARARFLQEIVGAHDETGEAVFWFSTKSRDLTRVEHGLGRFHHRPEARLTRRVNGTQNLGHRDDIALL